jgi:type II secretory pathway component PulF
MSNFARKSATAKPSPALKSAPKRDSYWDSATEANKSNRKPKNIASFSKRVGKKELVNLTSQMAIMAKSGVDVASALQSIVRQCAHPTLKMVLEDVHENVLGGNSVSESLAQYPAIFNETFVASVAAGEASGKLPDVLHHLSQLLRGEMKLRNSIRAMLAYPVLLTLVASSVLAALVIFVLPRFAEIFSDMDAELPFITQMVLGISNEFRARFWLWIPAIAGTGAGLWLFKRSPTGKRLWDHFTLTSPILRDVTRILIIGRLCRLLGLMIDSGVPLLDSMRLARASVKNSLYQQLFLRLEDDVLNGRGLSTGLSESPYVPGAASEMIMTAEKTGSLGTVSSMIGLHFEEEGEAKLKELVSIAEPVITVVMGVVVAVIVMSVMLPLFDLSSAAGKGH